MFLSERRERAPTPLVPQKGSANASLFLIVLAIIVAVRSSTHNVFDGSYSSRRGRQMVIFKCVRVAPERDHSRPLKTHDIGFGREHNNRIDPRVVTLAYTFRGEI